MSIRPIFSRSQGFGMIEVLVAVFVLTVGMLGIAAMQVTALRSVHVGELRTQAAILAYDIGDRMRGNSLGFAAGSYNIAHGAATPGLPDCSVSCDSTSIATYDHSQWLTRLAEELPEGAGAIAGTQITVRWDSMRNGAIGTNCPPLSENDLRCFQIQVNP